MKHYLLLLLLIVTAKAGAQITINRNNLISSGQKVVQATHLNSYGFAASGANLTWDFTGLNADFIDSLRFGQPFWYEGYQNFPDANLAFKSYLYDNEVTYLKADNSELRIMGFYTFDDTSETTVPLNSKLIGFPATYNSSFNETSKTVITVLGLGIDPDSSGPFPTIDSIRVNLIRSSKSIINGWGTVQTPFGNFASIKQTLLDVTSQSFDMKTSGFWLAVPESFIDQLGMPLPPPDSNYTVNFWTNDASAGFPVVTYQYAPGDDSASEVSWLMSQPSASGLNGISLNTIQVYPNPISDLLNIQSEMDALQITILDCEGKFVEDIHLRNERQIRLDHLSSGIYLLQINNAASGQMIQTIKISKQ